MLSEAGVPFDPASKLLFSGVWPDGSAVGRFREGSVVKRKFRVLVLLASLITIVPIARGLVEPSSVIPQPRYENDWEHQVAQQFEAVTAEDYELVFVGDSITEYWGREGQDVWNEYFGNRNALNFGIGGDRTENVLWRIDHAQLDQLSPKVAVVMIGVNNYDVNDAYEISEGTRTIVDRLSDLWPDAQILVMGILPAGWRAPNELRDTMAAASARVERTVPGGNVHYLNINERFLDAEGYLLPGLLIDAFHLSPKGYRVWAEEMEPVIAELLGDAIRMPERFQSRSPLASADTGASREG